MAKPPPVEYFEFICRTPVATAGPIMAALTRMEGLDVSAPRLVSEVRTYAKNERTPGSDPSMTAHVFLANWIKDHPTFRAKEVIAAFRADGRTDGAGYTALRVLCEEKILKKLGEGQYARADVKQIAAPKKAKAKKSRKGIKHHDISNADFVLRAMSRAHGKMTSATIKRHFESEGRSPTGVGPTLNKLRVDGMVKQLGEGQYELTARYYKDKPAPKSNGAAAVEATAEA